MLETPLRRIRRARKFTLKYIAEKIQTDTGNLSRIEQGKQISVVLAERLAKFFDGEITEAEILYPDRYSERYAAPAPAEKDHPPDRRKPKPPETPPCLATTANTKSA